MEQLGKKAFGDYADFTLNLNGAYDFSELLEKAATELSLIHILVFRSLRMLRSDCPRTAASWVVLYSRKERKYKTSLCSSLSSSTCLLYTSRNI